MHKRHFIQSMRLPGLLDIARRSTICYTYYPGILLFPLAVAQWATTEQIVS